MRAPGIKISTAATPEPLTTAEAKAHLRVTSSADDTYIGALITAARTAAETFTGMTVAATGYTMSYDAWPLSLGPWWDGTRQGDMSLVTGIPNALEIPRPPLVTVASITTYDDSDAATVMDAASYYVDISDPLRPGRIVLRRGYTWPVALRVANAIVIITTAGFGTTFPLPGDFRQAILQVIGTLYKKRGDCSEADSCMASIGGPLLEKYRIMNLGGRR